MRTLAICLTLVMLGLSLPPPLFAGGASKCESLTKFKPGTLKGFVSYNSYEKTFDVMYKSPFTLPVDESTFVEFLRKNNLVFEVRATGDEAGCDDFPLVDRLIDRNIRKTYEITDRAQLRAGRGVHFEAFVDNTGRVTYVENRFEYDGP